MKIDKSPGDAVPAGLLQIKRPLVLNRRSDPARLPCPQRHDIPCPSFACRGGSPVLGFRYNSILQPINGADGMATLTIKNIPTDLYERLKESAAQDRRSINNQVIVCLERALRSPKIDTDAVLAGARALRRKTSRYLLTDRTLARVKQEGRP